MAIYEQVATWGNEHPSVRYVAPFVVFMVLLFIAAHVHMDARWEAPSRVLLLGTVCAVCWPRELSGRAAQPVTAVAIGAAVFVLWIAPDLFIPGYRHTVLFSNSIVGHPHSSIEPSALHDPWVLTWRTIRAVAIVPVIEELFWRAWLMRWLIDTDFRRVPLGAYSPFAFWVTALMFASEHGSYWDVGLLTGIVYNYWMVRSKSVTSCILMHAVTNALLSAYVIATAQWQYWQ
ncbi:MAG: CAAX prenyl protease-related protein [Acidobacteriaceae bacterium]|nr:CAAX prenyl protease-related protein [Acidobacteriaceae bacterium]